MANKKLTDLTELTTPADGDFLYIVDVSDTTESAQGTSKKIRKDKVDSGASKENLANKQNDLTIDGTGTKYPTVDAVNNALPTTYSKVVYVNATSPTTATIFDTENPPVTNDNALKNDTANLYIGTDASTWVYLTGTGYVTKTVSSATSNFNTFGTSVDAGNSKTSHITRSGAVTLTGSLNLAIAKISTTPNTSAGSYDILTRNSSTTALEKKLLSDFVQVTGIQSIVGRKSFTSTDLVAGGIGILNTKTTGGGEAYGLGVYNTGSAGIYVENTTSGTTGNALFVVNQSNTGSGLSAGNFGAGNLITLRNQGGTGDLLYAELGKVTISSAGKLSTTELATTGNNVPNKTYVDGKITQTITNGVTDKSPSEDAVFDALALKVNGSGNTNYVPKFTASGTIGNSQIYDNGTNIGVFTTSTLAGFDISDNTFVLGSDGALKTRTDGVAKTSRIMRPHTLTSQGLFTTLFAVGSEVRFGGGTGAGKASTVISFWTASDEITSTGTERMRVNSAGNMLINTTTDDGVATNRLQVSGNVKATQFRISALNTAPTSATDTGTLGEIRITATYIYVCTATNTWVRTALTTW